jgi:hypothetical protein
MDFIETGSEDMNCIILAQERVQLKGLVSYQLSVALDEM